MKKTNLQVMAKSLLYGLFVVCLIAQATARAATMNVIVNGGFEAGLAVWQHVNAGDGSWMVQTGTHDPLTGIFTVPAPPELNFAAMTDQNSAGTHLLYQDFFVPLGTTAATLQFSRYINNANGHLGPFVSPNSLNYLPIQTNQQARVDIMNNLGAPDSVSAANVLQNVFQTQPGDALVSGYTTQSTDLSALISAHAGQILRLRFAEVDDFGFFYFGVDNVSLTVTTVPEPSSLMLAAFGFAGLAAWGWRRRSG